MYIRVHGGIAIAYRPLAVGIVWRSVRRLIVDRLNGNGWEVAAGLADGLEWELWMGFWPR